MAATSDVVVVKDEAASLTPVPTDEAVDLMFELMLCQSISGSSKLLTSSSDGMISWAELHAAEGADEALSHN